MDGVVFSIGGSSRIGFEWIRMIQRIDVDNDFKIVAIDVLSLSIFLGTLTHEWQKTVGDAAAHGGSTVLIQWKGVVATRALISCFLIFLLRLLWS